MKRNQINYFDEQKSKQITEDGKEWIKKCSDHLTKTINKDIMKIIWIYDGNKTK